MLFRSFNCKPPSLDEYFASSRYAVQRAYSAELGVWDENNGRRSPSEASFTDVSSVVSTELSTGEGHI